MLARIRATAAAGPAPAPARSWPARPTPAAPSCGNATSTWSSRTRRRDPNRKNRGSRGGRPPGFTPQVYKRRNSVERAINKLKQNRAVATRYDNRDYVWRGTVDVAAIRTWLRDPTQ